MLLRELFNILSFNISFLSYLKTNFMLSDICWPDPRITLFEADSYCGTKFEYLFL